MPIGRRIPVPARTGAAFGGVDSQPSDRHADSPPGHGVAGWGARQSRSHEARRRPSGFGAGARGSPSGRRGPPPAARGSPEHSLLAAGRSWLAGALVPAEFAPGERYVRSLRGGTGWRGLRRRHGPRVEHEHARCAGLEPRASRRDAREADIAFCRCKSCRMRGAGQREEPRASTRDGREADIAFCRCKSCRMRGAGDTYAGRETRTQGGTTGRTRGRGAGVMRTRGTGVTQGAAHRHPRPRGYLMVTVDAGVRARRSVATPGCSTAGSHVYVPVVSTRAR